MILSPISLAQALLAGSATLIPLHCTDPAPQPKPLPNCITDVVIWDMNDTTPNCNLNPPQTLVLILPTGGDADMATCDDLGGQVLIHRGEALCINVDY